MNNNDFIFASYGALIVAASFTMVLYAIYLKQKWIGWRSFLNEAFRVALGVFFISAFTVIVRSYFQAWRSGSYIGVDTSFMLEHVVVAYMILGFCFWYNWHTASITYRKYKHKIWLISAASTIGAFFMTYWFSQHNQWAKDLVEWLTHL